MPIVQLPELNMSRSQEMRNKRWIKRLDRVDTSKKDGYAFVGEFEKFQGTVEAEVGTWFMVFCEDRRASGRLDGIEVKLYQVGEAGLSMAHKWDLDGTPGWALKVRDEIAKIVSTPPAVDPINGDRKQIAIAVWEVYLTATVENARTAIEATAESLARLFYPDSDELRKRFVGMCCTLPTIE